MKLFILSLYHQYCIFTLFSALACYCWMLRLRLGEGKPGSCALAPAAPCPDLIHVISNHTLSSKPNHVTMPGFTRHGDSILPTSQKEDNLRTWVDSTNKPRHQSKTHRALALWFILALATAGSRNGHSRSVLAWSTFLTSNPLPFTSPESYWSQHVPWPG